MTTEITLEPKLDGQQSALVRELEHWQQIRNQAELESAIELCKEARTIIKSIEAYFAPMKQAAHYAWKGICTKETQAIGRVESELKRVQRLGDDYRTRELERERAEAKRKYDEEHARQRELQRQLEEAALKRAAELEASGRPELAEKVLAKAEAIADAPLQAIEQVKVAASKQAGVATRTVWEYEIEDLSKVPIEFLQLNESLVKATIKHRDIPGLRRFERVASSIRG